jgi:hypothetical protein
VGWPSARAALSRAVGRPVGDSVSIDLQHSHWRPASCIRATNIPYSQLISLIKLRTNSHHLDIKRLRHTTVGPDSSQITQSVSLVLRPSDAVQDEECIARWSGHHVSNTRIRYPAPCSELARWEHTVNSPLSPCSPPLNTWLL